MAERVGFEPTIESPLCRISSAVLSTTQPPLRQGFRDRPAHRVKRACRPIRAAVHPKRRRLCRRRAVLYAYVWAIASFFLGNRGFFPPVPGQHCGKPKATTLNFYRWIGSLQPNMRRFPAAWLSSVSLHQSGEKAHIFNQRHIWVLCKAAAESYVAV